MGEPRQITSAAIESALNSLAALTKNSVHENFFDQHRSRYRFLLRMLGGVYSGGRILEVGASPGHVTALCAALGLPVDAVDLYPDQPFPPRAALRPLNLFEELSLPVHALDVSREALPFADGTFSVALFNETLEHLQGSPAHVMREMARTLAPGGRLIITTPNVASLRNRLALLAGRNVHTPLEVVINVAPYKCHNREYTLSEVTALARLAGLEPERRGCVNRGEPIAGAARRAARAFYYAITTFLPGARSLICVVARKPAG